MIPLKDVNPTRRPAVLTIALIAVCVLVFGYQQTKADDLSLGSRQGFICEYGLIADNVAHGPGLGWAQLITSMFMHGGWQHILGNMLFLWVFGNNIEDSMGHTRFILFYLICGVAAGLAHVFFSPQSQIPAVGASGAIGGVMGAYVVLYPQARVQTWIPPLFIVNIRAWFFLIYWFGIQLFMGVGTLGTRDDSGGVAVWAHVGGFVAGLVLIKPFENRRLVEARKHGILLSREQVARDEWRL